MHYFFVALLLVILSGCTLFSQQNNNVPAVDTVKDGSVPINQGIEDPQVRKYVQYTNEKYDFELKFPGEWYGFVVKERVLSWGDSAFGNSMDFGFMKNNEIESLFNINVHTKDAWVKLQASEGLKPTFLGENNEYVLGWDMSQDASDEIMMARRAQTAEIIASFQWTKK